MLKSFRNKIKSLTKAQQNTLTIILILLDLFVIILLASSFFSLRKTILSPKVAEKPPVEEISEPLKPGEIGEITGKEVEEKGILLPPPTIFNTSGTISEVKSDRLIVQGSGSNFVDQKPRELTLIFTDSTITFESGQRIKYQGLEGLKHLRIGEVIGISSPENIRGKNQFVVDYINK